jgi:hypothetical protein
MKKISYISPPLGIKVHHFDKNYDKVFYKISTQIMILSIIRNIKHIS